MDLCTHCKLFNISGSYHSHKLCSIFSTRISREDGVWQGSGFTSSEFKEFLFHNGIKHIIPHPIINHWMVWQKEQCRSLRAQSRSWKAWWKKDFLHFCLNIVLLLGQLQVFLQQNSWWGGDWEYIWIYYILTLLRMCKTNSRSCQRRRLRDYFK